MRRFVIVALLFGIGCEPAHHDAEARDGQLVEASPPAASSIVPVPPGLARSTPDWKPFLQFEGEFVWGGQPKEPTQILALDSDDVWFVLSARVLKVVTGKLPEDWSSQVNFGVHSPTFYFLSQGLRVQDGVYVPEGRFLFSLWRSSNPPWVLELHHLSGPTGF